MGRPSHGDVVMAMSGESGIDQDKSGDVGRMQFGIEGHVLAASRVPDQEQWGMYAGRRERLVKIVDDIRPRRWPAIRIAEAIAGAIVRTNARELGDVTLHQAPSETEITSAGIENHGDFSGARATQVDFPAITQSDQLPRLRIVRHQSAGVRRNILRLPRWGGEERLAKSECHDRGEASTAQ